MSESTLDFSSPVVSYHHHSPEHTERRQEDLRTNLVRDYSRRRLENSVRDEEHKRRNRIPVALVGFQVIVHASDSSVGPSHWSEVILRRSYFLVASYMLPLSMSETQYINLRRKENRSQHDDQHIASVDTLCTYPSITTSRLSIRWMMLRCSA